jgi:hypothetical protein
MSTSFRFPKFEEINPIIQLARREDLAEDDVTSRLLIGQDAVGVGTIFQKEVGITCGLPIVEMVCRVYDASSPSPGFTWILLKAASAKPAASRWCAFAGRFARYFRRSACS